MSFLTLAEAKAHLNITKTTSDAEVSIFIASAEAVITQRCGPLLPTTVSTRVAGGRNVLPLPVMPALTLTSVTPTSPGWAPLVLSDLYLDPACALVTSNTGGYFSAPAYDVTYVAGRTEVPDDLLHAVKELVRHLWATSQRGGSRRPGSEAMAIPGPNYLLPYQVQSLIEPHTQPGFG